MESVIIKNKVKNTINYTTKKNNDTLTESSLMCCPRGLSKNSIKKNKIGDEIKLNSLTTSELTDVIDSIKKLKTPEGAEYNIEMFTALGPITYKAMMISKKDVNKLTANNIFDDILLRYGLFEIYGIGVSVFNQNK